MLKYLIKRLLQSVPLLILITILCFTLINLAPYDAIDAQITEDMTAEDVARLREEAGIDDPVPVQYIRWVSNVMKGDLGRSLISRTNIAEDLKVKILCECSSSGKGTTERLGCV